MRLNLITASLVASVALAGCKKKEPEPAPKAAAPAAEESPGMKVVEKEDTSQETKTLTKEEDKEDEKKDE